MSQETANDDTGASKRLPGADLKAKREAGGHSLEAVATHTRITRSKLMALEADDYGKMGGDTFVIGYIRQYARWLGVEADPLVQAFEEIVSGDHKDADERESGDAERYFTRKNYTPKNYAEPDNWILRNGASLLWAFAALLALCFLAFAVVNGPGEDNSSQQDTPRPAVTEEPSSIGGDSVEEIEGAITEERMSEEAMGGDSATSNAAAPNAVPPADVEMPAQTAPADTFAVEPRAEPNTVAPSQSVATDTLAMSFSGPCWVEVTDADGDLLFAQLQEASDNLQLSGKAPFEIMLGNARAVTLLVNDQIVNTNPGPDRDTLRLSVGP